MMYLLFALSALVASAFGQSFSEIQNSANTELQTVVGQIDAFNPLIDNFVTAAEALRAVADSAVNVNAVKNTLGGIKDSAGDNDFDELESELKDIIRILNKIRGDFQKLGKAVSPGRVNKISSIRSNFDGYRPQLVLSLADPNGPSCGNLSPDDANVYVSANRCYFIAGNSLNWDSARANCQQRGMDLATVDNADEQSFLQGVLSGRSDSHSHYWLSGRRDESGNFRWWAQNNDAVQGYTNWHSGEPNNWGGYEGCLMIWRNYQWNDAGCGHGRPSICQGY